MDQKTGAAAMLAIIAALGGFVLTLTGSPGWGLLVELLAMLLGGIGFFMAASPRVSGAVLSIVAVVVAIFGVGLSVLGLFGSLIF
ncbi:MAG TPA: hypothetical protein VNO43_15525 [Candidatus Eisenbacteria bacterium]|nr:hypothetical protein [Candidatus Eisenbacteria bacterium]